MKTNGDDLAYPFKVSDVQNYQHIEGGLTKREYFAALAMQGFISSYGTGSVKDFVKQSVDMADALIAELNTQAKEPENLDEKYEYKPGTGK